MKKLLFVSVASLILNFNIYAADEVVAANKTPLSNIQQLYPSFADIVEPLVPAVVNIQTEYKRNKNLSVRKNPLPDQFFSEYFFDFFEQQLATPFGLEDQQQSQVNTASGSGFIIDPSGYIVTNHHVIANADEIRIKLIDNIEVTAKLIGSDPKTDLALLKINTKSPLPFVKFGSSTNTRVGDWIIAIGNPFGLGGTVTTGIISSKGRDIDIETGGIIDNFLQTDAAINKGNSGGPMFNLSGEVIGVNTAIYSPSGMSIGIGFAIPSDTTQTIIEQLKKYGEVSRGTLDVTIQEVTEEIAEALGLKATSGVLIVQVVPGGAGEAAGLKSGDVVTEFAGQAVKNARKLQILVAETPINKEIKMTIIRSGKNLELSGKITKATNNPLNTRNNNIENKEVTPEAISKQSITFNNLTSDLIKQFNLPSSTTGIIVTTVNRIKNNYGLKLGDIVLEINHQPIANVSQFNKIYENVSKVEKKKRVILLVKRRNLNIYIAFPTDSQELSPNS